MGSRLRRRLLGVGLVVVAGALFFASSAWAGGTWKYTSSDHRQLQISFQTDNGNPAFYEVFVLSVPVVSATCPGGGAGVVQQPDPNPDEFECQISPSASSGTVTVTTDPEQCSADITNEASFDNNTYTPQNPITPAAHNCPAASPSASFTFSPSPARVGGPVSFDGTASSDPNSGGSITGYRWNFGDGSAAGSGATPTHSYAAPGTYAVMLTVTDAEGGTASTTHQVTVTSGPAGHPPVNTGLPQISGTPTIGNPLTATPGTWTNGPTSFDYQWLECTSTGCVDAPGSSQSEQYTVTGGNEGKQIAVKVTAHNAFGSADATSARTASVTQTVPVTLGSATTNGNTATVPIQCQGTADANCLLLILLTALGGGHASDVATAGGTRAGQAHHRPLVLGRTKLTVPAGHTKHVQIRLNRAGRRLLAKDHRLKVKLTITEKGHTLFTRTIVFRSKPAKKHG